jgi:hypothetical protein
MRNQDRDVAYDVPDETFFDEVKEMGDMMVDAVVPSPLFIYFYNTQTDKVMFSYMMEPKDVVKNQGKKLNLGEIGEAFVANIPRDNFQNKFEAIRSQHGNVCVMSRDLALSPWLSIDAYSEKTGKSVFVGPGEGPKDTGMLRERDGFYLSNSDFKSMSVTDPDFKYPEISVLPSLSLKDTYKAFAEPSRSLKATAESPTI